MKAEPIRVTADQARRLALSKQRLRGRPRTRPSKKSILALVRDLAYVQWDPVNVVAPSHEIVFWSRLGPFGRTDFENLLWKEKGLFYGWGHSASLCLTEDYPLHASFMRRYPESLSSSWGHWKRYALKWLPAHRGLRKTVLRDLGDGPKKVGDFPDHRRTRQSGNGWSSGSDVSEMLAHLQLSGDVMIVGHDGRENIWGLTEQFLPDAARSDELSRAEAESLGAQRAIRALGVASRSEVNFYFPRGRYLDLAGTFARLEAESLIRPVRIEGSLKGAPRFMHTADLAALETLGEPDDDPRTTLLSPFDNLTTCRGLVHDLFGFDYIHENFVPKEKRKFGVYVLPILHGERLVGRIDPRLDRENRRLMVNAVFAEPAPRPERELGAAVARTIEDLAAFLSAGEVEYTPRVPAIWRRDLR